jgi:hypothetical protein
MTGGSAAARRAVAVHGPALVLGRDVTAVAVGTKVVAGRDTGVGCVTVWVRRKLAVPELAPGELLPAVLAVDTGGEVPLDVLESGTITGPPPLAVETPGPEVVALRQPCRPVQGGVSAANWRFDLGTLTVTATDSLDPAVGFALSCNHVLAGLNRFPLGDPVLQPAPIDGGTWPAAAVGQLARFYPMQFDGTPNPVDAAVAYLPGGVGTAAVLGLGTVPAVRAAAGLTIGEPVCKVGRSTGLTDARIVGLDALVWADYRMTGLGGRALLSHQILTTPCAGYGDSGSLLLDADLRGIGILCAGSTLTTVFSGLEMVQTELDIVVATTLE